MARATYSPGKLVVYEIAAGHSVRLFRIVRSELKDDPLYEQSFRSNYELGAEPRRVEKRSAILHMGLSMWLREDQAHDLATRMPKVGDWVAELRLNPDHGINWAETGMPYHVTVWGRPLQLVESVVDIVPVER